MKSAWAKHASTKHTPKLWPTILLAVFISWFLLSLNLFKHVTALERYGQVLFNEVFGPGLYTRQDGRRGEGSRDQIVVVLLGEEDLERLGDPEKPLAWPITYGDHAQILGAIRDLLRPRALMIDFLFIDDRPGDTSLAVLLDELESYRVAGIPVFLASPTVSGPTTAVIGSLREVKELELVPVPRLAGEGRDERYPFYFDACAGDEAAKDRGGDEPRAGSPIEPQAKERRRTAPCPRLTAAPAIYRAVCGPEPHVELRHGDRQPPRASLCAAPRLSIPELA